MKKRFDGPYLLDNLGNPRHLETYDFTGGLSPFTSNSVDGPASVLPLVRVTGIFDDKLRFVASLHNLLLREPLKPLELWLRVALGVATQHSSIVHGHTSLHPWFRGHDGRPVENVHDRLFCVASSHAVLSAAEVRTRLATCYRLELEDLSKC